MARSILLIEDSYDMRTALCALLEYEGYRVIEACDGQQGLEKLHEDGIPDLVILDMLMPLFDGWYFLEHFERDWQSPVPVIVTTALACGAQWSTACGRNGFVEKPPERSALVKEIERCLKNDSRVQAAGSVEASSSPELSHHKQHR